MRQESSTKLKSTFLSAAICITFLFGVIRMAWGQDANAPGQIIPVDPNTNIELAGYEQEHSSAHIMPARMGSDAGIAVIFEGTKDLHYYANPETTPAPGYELKVRAKSDIFEFGPAVFPKWSTFTDPLGKKVEVYVGNFNVFVPVEAVKNPAKTAGQADVTISGLACTSILCLEPFEKTLRTMLDWSRRDTWPQINLESSAAIVVWW